MVLGMSSDKALLDAGVQIVSNLVQLGFSDRLVAAIPVLVSQCAQHPADTTRSRPILVMASKRELRLALRESKILSSIKSWLKHREGDSKVGSFPPFSPWQIESQIPTHEIPSFLISACMAARGGRGGGN